MGETALLAPRLPDDSTGTFTPPPVAHLHEGWLAPLGGGLAATGQRKQMWFDLRENLDLLANHPPIGLDVLINDE